MGVKFVEINIKKNSAYSVFELARNYIHVHVLVLTFPAIVPGWIVIWFPASANNYIRYDCKLTFVRAISI